MTNVEYYSFESDVEVGDPVIFECATLKGVGPRWLFNDDLGSTGVWATGRVKYVDNRIIQVEYSIPGMGDDAQCVWPNFDHPDYDPLQWIQDGYLRWSDDYESPICECGAEKSNTTHSVWCPKYR